MYITIRVEHSPLQWSWWQHWLDSNNYLLCLQRDSGVGSLFWAAGCCFFLGRTGEHAAEEIFWAVLRASFSDHKQSEHMFFIALLACYSLHSCGARRSKITDSYCCLTSRRIHHCWASCLEMLMLLWGFFRTLGQRLPHQICLSFAALSQAMLYSQSNLFSMSDKPGGPQR